MLKAIIFDFDGVIVDTELKRFEFLKKILKKHDYDLKDGDFSKLVGKKTINAIEELFPKIPNSIKRRIIQERKKSLNKEILRLKPIEELAMILNFLSKKYALAISTGTSRELCVSFLKKHGLLNFFRIIVTGEQFRSSKPDPEGFKLTITKLRVRPSEVIIVEDSRVGIEAAKKLKCKVFGIRNKYNSSQIKNADKTFDGYRQMMNYFKTA